MSSSSSASGPMGRLIAYAQGHRQRVWAACVCSVLNKAFDLAPPVLIGAAVDIAVSREASWLGQAGIRDLSTQLSLLVVATIVIWGLESAFEYAFQRLWRGLAQSVQHELRVDTFRHVTSMPLADIQARRTGGVMSIVGDDVNQLERFLDGGANDLLQVATTVVLVTAAFFAASPTIACAAIAPVPFVIIGSFLFQRRIGTRYTAVRKQAADVNAQLITSIVGVAEIKAFGAEEHECQRLSEASQRYLDANSEAIRLSSAFVPIIRMVIVVGFAATLWLGGQATITGELDVGTYSVLVFLTQRLLWPLTRLGSTFDLYQRAMASATRIFELLDTPIPSVGQAQVLQSPRGEIRVEALDFHYPDREMLFDGLSLHVPGGGSLGVVGTTGSGKSTLVRLLTRLYRPDAGRIWLDDVSIEDLQAESLREHVALVSQEAQLFSGSVMDNIALGCPQAAVAAVQQAAKAAEAHDFICELPHGYDTEVGERGHRLSGGQRQRIAIARAILMDPAVLVLDEATASVDNETEAAIQRSLRTIATERTTVVVAHRLSTVRWCDQIIVLQAGDIIETGTHEQLLALQGAYHRLWTVQTGVRAQD